MLILEVLVYKKYRIVDGLLVLQLMNLKCFDAYCPYVLLFFHLKIFEWDFGVDRFAGAKLI